MKRDFASDVNYDPLRVRAELDRLSSKGPTWFSSLLLSFSGALEHGYLKHRALSVLTLQRIVVVVGMVLYSIFMVHDAATIQTFSSPLLWGTLMLFAMPGNIALLVASYMKEPWRYTLNIARLGAWFHTFGMLLVAGLAASRGVDVPFEYLMIQLLYDFFLLGLVWSEASVLALLTVIAGPLLMVLVRISPLQIFEISFFLGSTTLLGSIACFLQEKTQRIAWLESQLYQGMSERDPLTGTYNHRSFYSRGDKLLSQARREGRPAAVLGLDIDYFKRFNDVYGHLAGDECLRQVARVVIDHARRPLDLAGRLGGEEFAVFLYDTDRANALSRAEDLREAIKKLEMPGHVRVTCSIGVACATAADHLSMEEMIGNADTALYRAKNDERDCVREWSDGKEKPSLQLVNRLTTNKD
tara:strand:- start:2453 stop:3691 length:1239 start_codon:yes stop_codon:yes gene_type:complete